ncbi:XdhC family protein [Ochrovirga pacifica]|uniref:XdhC family protein n=1 Tax=Ochrovirga pacifica TaxID=1042376 RepID=UPI000255A840|nr:XdhC/CoxI family protein [Ochrovirga pacifica]
MNNHEFFDILTAYQQAKEQGVSSVLITLVALNGSSYRKEGVRMLMTKKGEFVGAVSGGCVEKEIWKQAQSVFETKEAKVMTYDGRFRLGCEGTLYLLIEFLKLKNHQIEKLKYWIKERKSFELKSHYSIEEKPWSGITKVDCLEDSFPLSVNKTSKFKEVLNQTIQPWFQLYILGAEHDVAALSQQARFLGWKTTVVLSLTSNKTLRDFAGADAVLYKAAGDVSELTFDDQTAVVLMHHNYARDLLFLKALKRKQSLYIGVLGAKKRGIQLCNDLLSEDMEVSETFLENLYTPTGLHIAAETPQEIALSITAQIVQLAKAHKKATLLQKITHV